MTMLGAPKGTSVAQWVALADGESSYRIWAQNGTHWGLWQIAENHLGEGIPGAPKDLEGFKKWLLSPWNNFIAAKFIYARQGWGAWTASHVPSAAHIDAAAHPNALGVLQSAGVQSPAKAAENFLDGIGDPVEKVAAAIKGIFDLGVKAGSWIGNRDNWSRVAIVFVGGTVIIVAAGAMVKTPLANTVGELNPT